MDLARALADRLPGVRVSTSAPDRLAYARDLWPRHLVELEGGPLSAGGPALVVWPRNAEDVVAIQHFAANAGYPLVPFGAGSGVCGAVLPDQRSIVLDLKEINDFSVDLDGPVLDAGAGLLGITLEDELAARGLTTGHFPSSIVCSTIGGWVAARGAGQCSSRYGKIEDMLVGLECVLGNGEVVRMQRRRSEPDLLGLMTGSEGTLGVITRVALRLHPSPATRGFEAFSFAGLEQGFEALRHMFQAGLRPAVARLYDPLDSILLAQSSDAKSAAKPRSRLVSRLFAPLARAALSAPRALERTISLLEGNLLGGATLVLVFEGEPDDVRADQSRALELCAQSGGRSLGAGPARAWLAHRYSVSFRQSSVFRLGAFSDTMEVSAPWSKLLDVYTEVRRALSEHALVMAHLSHAYPDGCSIYFTFSGLADGKDAALRYDAAWRAALAAAHANGASLSHHHGVGRSKASLLGAELGHGLALYKSLKRAWDPQGLLNPGALAPATDAGATNAIAAASNGPFEFDRISSLATFDANISLGSAETLLEARGLTLAVDAGVDRSLSLDAWAARGFPGSRDPLLDPVRGLVAGFSARVLGGQSFELRPAPRRATGPDLSALFVGAHNQIGHFERLSLYVERRNATPARPLPFHGARDPVPSSAERAAFQSVVRSVRTAPKLGT